MSAPRSRLRASLIAAILLILAGCAAPPPEDASGTTTTQPPANDGSDGGDGGSVAFYVKDAPADEFGEVYLTFCLVEIHEGGEDDGTTPTTETTEPGATTNDTTTGIFQTTGPGNNTTTSATTTAPTTAPPGNATTSPATTTTTAGNGTTCPTPGGRGAGGWSLIVDEEQTVDLKQYSGNARAFLDMNQVDAGTYTQIRIHVADAWGTDPGDGSRIDIRVPSEALKIVRPWTVAEGEVTELTVDFELNESLRQGGNGEWRLQPVMRLTVEQAGGEETFAPTETLTATDTATTNTTAMETTNTTATTTTSPTTTTATATPTTTST